jgi:hypothetical protein
VLIARRRERRLVAKIREVGVDHARCGGGKQIEADLVGEWDVTRVNLEDLAPPRLIRRVHGDAAIEAPGGVATLDPKSRAGSWRSATPR